MNSDRFLIASGQRSFHLEKTTTLENEVERLRILYKKNYFKRKEWKKKFKEKEEEMTKILNKLEKELEVFKSKVEFLLFQDTCETVDAIVQTHLEVNDINKIIMIYQNSIDLLISIEF